MSHLTAIYDLACSPPTYDAVSFLMAAEREKRRLGLDGIAVIITPGPDHGFRRDNLPPRDPALRLSMLSNIVLPLCRLLPSCMAVETPDSRNIGVEGPRFPDGWRPQRPTSLYGARLAIECAREGLAPFRAPAPIATCQRLLTMTLREASYWPTRNSDRRAWLEAARLLAREGWHVVIVPDAESPAFDEPLPDGVVLDAPAALDLIRRANLYAGARLNLFVNNGPAWLAAAMAQTNSAVVRMEAAEAPCVSDAYFKGVGLPRGTQLGRKGHHIAWSGESVPEIMAAVEMGLAA